MAEFIPGYYFPEGESARYDQLQGFDATFDLNTYFLQNQMVFDPQWDASQYVVPVWSGPDRPVIPEPADLSLESLDDYEGSFEGEGGIFGASTGVYPVFPGPVGGGQSVVPTPVDWDIEEVAQPVFEQPPPVWNPPRTFVPSTNVPDQVIVEYPEGDYPEGSIFAPGEAWGQGNQGDFEEQHELDREEEPVPLIEGWFGDIIDVFQGQTVTPRPPIFNPQTPYQAAIGGSPTGIPSGRPALPPGAAPMLDRFGRPCRRRRRRRLLTNSDLKDLAALKTITGNNDALKMAVIKAVR